MGELHRVAHEEHRGVVANHVEVAFVGVELQRESTDVTPRVGATEFTGDRGETSQHRGFLALLQEAGLGVLRDVSGGLEVSEGPRSLGVRLALGDVLAVEMGQGVNQVGVVQQHWAVGTDGQGVFVAGRGGTVRIS